MSAQARPGPARAACRSGAFTAPRTPCTATATRTYSLPCAGRRKLSDGSCAPPGISTANGSRAGSRTMLSSGASLSPERSARRRPGCETGSLGRAVTPGAAAALRSRPSANRPAVGRADGGAPGIPRTSAGPSGHLSDLGRPTGLRKPFAKGQGGATSSFSAPRRTGLQENLALFPDTGGGAPLRAVGPSADLTTLRALAMKRRAASAPGCFRHVWGQGRYNLPLRRPRARSPDRQLLRWWRREAWPGHR